MLLSHRVLMIAMGCMIVSLAPRAGADAKEDARKAIQAAYNSESAAISKKDANGAVADHSPDFVGVDTQGNRSTAAQNRAQMITVFKMASTLKASQNVQNIALKGQQAQVTVKCHVEVQIADPKTKQLHKLVNDVISEDTWIKGAKGWLLKYSKSVSEKFTMDGKAMSGK